MANTPSQQLHGHCIFTNHPAYNTAFLSNFIIATNKFLQLMLFLQLILYSHTIQVQFEFSCCTGPSIYTKQSKTFQEYPCHGRNRLSCTFHIAISLHVLLIQILLSLHRVLLCFSSNRLWLRLPSCLLKKCSYTLCKSYFQETEKG